MCDNHFSLSNTACSSSRNIGMDLELKGKRALVTGGSIGIGKACAKVLAEEGCEVIIASRDAVALQAAVQDIKEATGASVKWNAIDLSERGAAEKLATLAGDLDILVNNAGAIPGGDLLSVDEDTWRQAWDLKVFGYINLCRVVYRAMKSKRSGVIVNVLGTAGEKMNANYIAGSTGNAGLMAFTRALGSASPKDGIRVLGVSPGPVATDRLVSLFKQQAAMKLGDENRYQELYAGMAFDRPATAEEIAWTVTFAASARSSYTTGVYFTVDGGLAASR
jgi:NAD(P)-dependent dehydrogenase (short-subunit alcohol dehydrogenase family)